MADLKQLKNRIGSVKSTQKITKAMKMVAAAKLRRAKENAENARPYAEGMERMLGSLAQAAMASGNAPALVAGNDIQDKHLIIVATSDRGLCGGFNSSIVRAVRARIKQLQQDDKEVSIICVGRKGYDQLRFEFDTLVTDKIFDITKRKIGFADAESLATKVIGTFEANQVGNVSIIYNKFKTAISQEVTFAQLIPMPVEESQKNENPAEKNQDDGKPRHSAGISAPYEYEPSEEQVLTTLLPKNIGIQIYKALLENAASEQGSRMSAMDNATRNAGDMIKKLTLQYNRSRQAAITKELIEIISGAEAV